MFPVSEMQREERNAALRLMAEGKIKFLDGQSSKLCSGSLNKLKKMMHVFSNTPRIKSDNIIKVIDLLTDLEAEVSVKTELQEAEKQAKTTQLIPPQIAEPSGSNFVIRPDHSQRSTTPVTNCQSSHSKPYPKTHTVDDTITHEIFQMASSYQPQPIENSFINEERLSSKYPRKKKNPEVESTDSSSVFKTPVIPVKRGDDKLFFRRAEVFPAPAQSYIEHRMRKANEMKSPNNHQIGAELHRKSPLTSQNCTGQNAQPLPKNSHGFGTSTQTNTGPRSSNEYPSSSNLSLGVNPRSTPAIPIPDHGVTMGNKSPQPLSKPMHHLKPSAGNSKGIKESTGVTENTLPSSSTSSKNKLDKVNPSKKGQNILNREVHSLIVGEIEFTESMNRKKENDKLRNISNRMESENGRQKNKEWAKDLLKQYGMHNETRVLLTRLEDDNGIALRTRAKSTENREFPCSDSSNAISQNKKSPSSNGRITMRRKTMDCRETLTNLSQTNKIHEQAKNRKPKFRRKSVCANANSVTVTPEKTVQNNLYLSDNEDDNYEPPTKKQHINNRKSKSNRETAKKSSKNVTKSKQKAIPRGNAGAKTSSSPQENSTIDKQVDIPNDNPDIHCQSNFMSSCSLCCYRGAEMVDHYLSKHKQNEVFVSRISPRQSDVIRKFPIPFHASEKNVSKNGSDRLKRFCCFCEKNCVLTNKEWIAHIAQHTGEYEFDQKVKTAKKPFGEIKFQNNNILCYICDRCNYVQTRLSAMENHLEKQHFSLEDGPAKTTECIRFAVCRAKVESGSVENKIDLKLKPEPVFGCEVINNPIDKDEESIISDGMDHDILHELEKLHGYEPLLDSIVKEEIDLNSETECIQQCGKPANERTRERSSTELTAVRDDPMDYDSDDSLNTIPMDDPEYQHSMGGIKEEEFAEEFQKSGRNNPSECDKNIDQTQDVNVVPSLNESLTTENGNGTRQNEQNIINLSCVKAELQEAECAAKSTTCTVVQSNNGEPHESTKIQENRPNATIGDGNVDAMAEQSATNSNPFEIVGNKEQLQYLCFYSTNCKFVGSNAVSLEKHVQTKHSVERWSGYCHTCKDHIENQSGLTKQFAIHHLKHFLSKHSDPLPASNIQKPLKIRLRRLSGDKLSVINN
ncbi:uncharacterized protein LOC126577752 [Anopheles aquasalis]|uniref:uncharacterized protein LOC126577752 n=1 Tax=Anopheles aquasalis TaxID=42839 RepID=UPI00215ACF85|nr:uncharacterized protein LOC126577752 [Anopheles aquasalis]